MADLDKLVAMSRRSHAKMRPVLPLGQPLELGMVGYLDDHAFRYLGRVQTMLGEPPGKPLKGGGVPVVDLVSGKEVDLAIHAKGTTSQAFGDIAKGKARVEMTFGSDKSFLLSAKDITIYTMEDPVILLAAMLRAFEAGMWQQEYCLVYQIGVAASYTGVLSRQAGAKLLLSTSAKLGKGKASVGDVAAGMSFERQSGALEQVVAPRKTTAFFNAYRVKKRWFTGPSVQVAASLPVGASGEEIRGALKVKGDPMKAAFDPA